MQELTVHISITYVPCVEPAGTNRSQNQITTGTKMDSVPNVARNINPYFILTILSTTVNGGITYESETETYPAGDREGRCRQK